MMWRVGQKLLGSLSGDTNEVHNPWAEGDDLESQIIKVYDMGIRRGLTASDALAVAMAFQSANSGGVWAPELAKRLKKRASH